MVSFPNAKINLGLNVVSKRDDGFHNIETVFYPVLKLADILEVVESDKFTFAQTGILVDSLPEDNLCVKAYRLLEKEYNLSPVSIHLHKLIPLGAGLGGGSADASFMLKTLNSLFKLGLQNDELKQYAAKLGSDCAFFVDNKPSKAWGRGEQLIPFDIDISGLYILMVKPPVHVSTKDAYATIKPQVPKEKIEDILKLPVTEWKNKLNNDFETSIFPLHPIIANIKAKMYEIGAIYACMSGSGATVFGLFENQPDYKHLFDNMWCFCDRI